MTSSKSRRFPAGARRGGRLTSLLLLAGSLALAGAGVAEAFRAVRSHQATAESLLRDYGAFAAWTYRQRASEALTVSIDATLLPLRQVGESCSVDGLLRSVTGGEICGCSAGMPGEFAFRFRLSEGAEGIEFGGEPPGEADAGRIPALATEAVRARGSRGSFVVVRPDLAGGQRMLAVGWRPIEPGAAGRLAPDTLIFGVELDTARVRAVLETVYLESDLLPPTLTPDLPRSRVLSVALLRDDGGGAIFRSGDEAPRPGFAADDPLDPAFGGLVARAAVLPEAADGLIIGGLPGSRLPYLVGLFALAAALAVVSVLQLRKEQELTRLRSDFVASVSHELRTPLAQMRLFVETLRLGRTRTQKEREWFLENIETETLRLGHLVENVLQFSRSERGALSGESRRTDLGREIRRVEEVFERLSLSGRRDGTRLATRLEGDLHARVHPDSFRQVLLNFLDNAVKYGPRDQTISITGRRVEGAIRIFVEDEGPGVPAGERERIWEPFRRGDGAVGTVAVGSGIGLAVARALAERHGGRTRVEEAPGGGARFVVELPPAEPAVGEGVASPRRPGRDDSTPGDPLPDEENRIRVAAGGAGD